MAFDNTFKGCLLVKQSFFHGGLSLNMDVSTTMILTPGPVIDFLLANQNALEPRNIGWAKQLFTPIRIEWWVVVNFSAHCDTSHLSQELINCGRKRAFQYIERPHTLVEEDPQYRRSSPIVRVEKMFELIAGKLPGHPQFLLCVLPEKKISDSYGPWKKKSLSDFEIATQCIAPTKFNDQYLTNVLLKINSKTRNTTGLVALAIAASLGSLTHTLGTLVPMIRASGFATAAAATAIETVVDRFRYYLNSCRNV